MKLLSITITLLTIFNLVSCSTKSGKDVQKEPGLSVEFIEHQADKKIDVLIGGNLFTSFQWPENVYKPVLYPILTSAGTEITRGFPLEPRAGERPDHRHHVGNWLNYGNVNGTDFWGNGHAGVKSSNGGEIIHLGIEKLSPGKGEGTMITVSKWVDPNGKQLLSEQTEYRFIDKGTTRIIDRITTLTADTAVSFADTKEGMFAIRVARQLELPSDGEVTVLDALGNPEKIANSSVEGISGNYKSSEGITGAGVWSTRAKWMNLYGNIGDEKISIVICDHPENLNYPTYWHARDYGLFSANPMGAKDFSKGKEELNFNLPAGQSVTFRYRLVIGSNTHLTDEEINVLAEDFSQKR